MELQKSIIEIIKQRSSRRNYIKKHLDDKIKTKLINFFDECNTGPFGSNIRFKLIENPNFGEKQRIGTYGMISGASYYIAGAVKKSNRDMEDFGYAMEKLILFTTDMDLGTCWLGGSLNRNEFINFIELKKDEIIPAVTPVGYIEKEKKIKEKIISFLVKSKNRKPWNELFFYENFYNPLIQEQADDYKIPVEMVRLAPSAGNKQPWRILKENNMYHFYLARSKTYQMILKTIRFDLQRIDIGIAMCHFELACNELGLKGKWQLLKPEKNSNQEDVEYIISWVNIE